ncbi:hypothetical protein Tco_0075963, partial [Tanacetum coccineum]
MQTPCNSHLPLSDVSDSGSDENNTFARSGVGNDLFDHAHQMFDKMSVTETLEFLKRKPKTALSYIAHLRKCGFKHDVGSYMGVVRFLCYWGMIGRLKGVFLDVIEDKDGAFGFEVSELVEGLLREV